MPYSWYPEDEIVHSTAARSTIPKMDQIFATHGIPKVSKSDNGPPFASEEIDEGVHGGEMNNELILYGPRQIPK